MKVEFFGRLVELAGARSVDAPDSCADVAGVIGWLALDRPALADALRSDTVRAVVDDRFADAGTALRDTSALAFIPPVSGG
jgi:molybdopterin converting factor small subunit